MSKTDEDAIIDPSVTCTGCGACCTHMVRPPFMIIDDADWNRLIKWRPDLVMEINADREVRHCDDPAPCLWFDADRRTCKHYDYRPEVCRDYEPGCQSCLDHRARVGVVTIGGAA